MSSRCPQRHKDTVTGRLDVLKDTETIKGTQDSLRDNKKAMTARQDVLQDTRIQLQGHKMFSETKTTCPHKH